MKSNTESDRITSPFSIPNIRLFIAFRIFNNLRFYYPVFTILFLDFGLTIAQFSTLNAIWAATIVLSEVPSGALADILGRKRLLVFAACVMILEIAVISFAPVTNPGLVFTFFMINRILSGLGSAAASGADEAIAYDTLKQEGNPDDWGRVLEILMRFQSIGFIIAMSVGAAIYDPELVSRFCGFFGFDIALTQQTTMRFPLYLTLVMSLLSLWVTLKMKEPVLKEEEQKINKDSSASSDAPDSKNIPAGEAFRLTLATGGWIIKTPFVLTIILFGMLFDGVIRLAITLASQYYRVIEIPESLFGVIGSAVSALGFFIPKIARNIAEKRSPAYSLLFTGGITLAGLSGMCFFWPYTGVIPSAITFSAMYFTGFFVSFYINKKTSSEKRATVLSFKGLLYNVSYGLLGVGYALLLKMKKNAGITGDAIPTQNLENVLFMDSFIWFPLLFIAGFFLLLIIYSLWLRKKMPGS